MAKENRDQLVRRYREGADELAGVIANLTPEQLDHKPADGGWSARECVHHTADSEITSAIRLRRLVAEENPRITGYDPDQFADRLHYSERPVEPSLEAIRWARESTASILDRLTPSEWERAGTHSETGTYSVDRWLEIYAEHCHAHADQARRAAGLVDNRDGNRT